jgi:hypothetical protein
MAVQPTTPVLGRVIGPEDDTVQRIPRQLALAALALLATLALAGPALAAKPQMERLQVDDLFVDGFLSDACGAEVTAHITGHITFRAFTDGADNVVREVNNYALTATYSSANGSVRAKDVGVDRVAYAPDGSFVNVIVGNVQSFNIPGQGRVYQDTGQVTLRFTFDEEGNATIEVLDDSKGQHDPDQVGPLCSVLGT